MSQPVRKVSAQHAKNLAHFEEALKQHRFWHVLPEGEDSPDKAVGLFDVKTKQCYPPLAEWQGFLRSHPFIFVHDALQEARLATLEVATGSLWNNETSNNAYSLDDGKKVVKAGDWAGLKGWTLPSQGDLGAFAQRANNPHRAGGSYRLATQNGTAVDRWLTQAGGFDLDSGYWRITSDYGCIFACNPFWRQASDAEKLAVIVARNWHLKSPDGAVFQPGQVVQHDAVEVWLDQWSVDKVVLLADTTDEAKVSLDPRRYWIECQFVDTDYTPCRLPKLESAQWSDPEKGLWELWGESADFLSRCAFVARDPSRDLKQRAIAIDFGTSSTVVAVNTERGGRELLRIGVRDFYQDPEPLHFENPTVLECLDFAAFHRVWTEQAYRPALDWNWMRAAHEAQASFRDNPGDTAILASILPRLKQWALRSEQRRVRLSDRQGQEIEVPAHTERNPVRGQPLRVGGDDLFDPIELYAWYLGMTINWRGRGLFLKYYLSFPVRYAREVKERILASFRRGLQRSLPPTLIDSAPQVLNEFEVNDLATEPAAYAAAALAHLDIEPSDEGVPYAVFDFGGGTTDFDFGLLRWANTEEEEGGYERVFEHLASSGDNFLGGENLLEHLVYESFRHNLDVMRKERIQFTQPLDAAPFAGSEAFLASTQAAQTNTVMLAARLRGFLEGHDAALEPQIKMDLIDSSGLKKTCELAFDVEGLDALLAGRIRRGVEAFLDKLARLVPELPAHQPIHVLLAGNGSRSRHVQSLFDVESTDWAELLSSVFGDQPPQIQVHPPLPIDPDNPHAPTTKTGVALGLLRLAPGNNTLLCNHVQARHDGQAPFAWFVGRLWKGRFDPRLLQGAVYGEWHELGPLQHGVFNLYTSTSPRAHNGLKEGDPELKMYRLDFPAAPAGAKLFAKATAPDKLMLCAAMDIDMGGNPGDRELVLE